MVRPIAAIWGIQRTLAGAPQLLEWQLPMPNGLRVTSVDRSGAGLASSAVACPRCADSATQAPMVVSSMHQTNRRVFMVSALLGSEIANSLLMGAPADFKPGNAAAVEPPAKPTNHPTYLLHSKT